MQIHLSWLLYHYSCYTHMTRKKFSKVKRFYPKSYDYNVNSNDLVDCYVFHTNLHCQLSQDVTNVCMNFPQASSAINFLTLPIFHR